ncbi:hypothetical protein QE152_g5728 [Popillia japonica]|uniref:Uncharacterized protein n=1 Tax=Popillia japonica TaxID=7064 RepID=A0AAW1MLG8_POPJA
MRLLGLATSPCSRAEPHMVSCCGVHHRRWKLSSGWLLRHVREQSHIWYLVVGCIIGDGNYLQVTEGSCSSISRGTKTNNLQKSIPRTSNTYLTFLICPSVSPNKQESAHYKPPCNKTLQSTSRRDEGHVQTKLSVSGQGVFDAANVL